MFNPDFWLIHWNLIQGMVARYVIFKVFSENLDFGFDKTPFHENFG